MSDFQALFTGRLWSVMSWEQLDAFWQRIDPAAGWYVYAVGEPVPATPATAEAVSAFIAQIDALLRKEHHHDYCGIVYADDLDTPRFVKIFDPNNLGVSCGFSDNPPLPGWILCRVPPQVLKPSVPLPEGRKRWWRALFE
ncbi:MAG: hypothetical protein Q8L56_02070 [Rhodocyclaceae bacterium]|nr:hypothetical protein [Rhodocyclaceae bacterium]